MNKLRKKLRPYVKWIIAAIAAINLVWLFIFNYQIPFVGGLFNKEAGVSTDESEISELQEESAAGENEAALEIHIPDTELLYDGTSKLDLLSGVSVTNAAGEMVDDIQIFTAIKPGTTRKDKVIEYSITDEFGSRITKERPLTLSDDYSGPMIEIRGEIPFASGDELTGIVSILRDQHVIYADDGFGVEITAAVTSSVKSETDLDDNAVVTLSVTNVVNDTYSVDINVPSKITGPTIRLTTNRTTLSVGDNFSFYEYIEYAVDDDGSDLSRYISIEGQVDTSTPGEYELVFFCNDTDGNVSERKTLTVVVQ